MSGNTAPLTRASPSNICPGVVAVPSRNDITRAPDAGADAIFISRPLRYISEGA